MHITALQLRRNPDLLYGAVQRGEPVELTYRGKVIATVVPAVSSPVPSVLADPFFGSAPGAGTGVEEVQRMRQVRHAH